MYPPKDRDEQKAKTSTDNARDIADAIDHLIRIRVHGALMVNHGVTDTKSLKDLDESCELLLRRITDYLLVTDPRPGVYVNK